MRITAVGPLILFFALASTVNAESPSDQLTHLASRTPAEVERLISVKGDGLDPVITVSTYRATQLVSKGLLASTTLENNFLRGFIDRKSGVVTAQIYHIAKYNGPTWNFFNSATYESLSGLREVEADRIDSDVHCGEYFCSYTEDVGIPVRFSDLEAVAGRWSPQTAFTGLKYRLFGKSGRTIDDAIPLNEIVAFVNVVHRNGGRATDTPPSPPRAQAAPAPAPDVTSAPPAPVAPAPKKSRTEPTPHIRCITCR